MNVIYLISIIIILVSFILKKKTNKNVNLVSFICLSITLLFCYNSLIYYIFTFFTISTKLWILTLINLIISLVLFIYIKKDKSIQKYNFDKLDAIFIILIIIVTLAVAYLNFGFPFNVNYETGDSSVHYLASVRFAKSDALMPGIKEINDEVYGDFSGLRFVSYVNSGLLMKCICPQLEIMDSYNVFVCFGIFILMLTGISLYGAFINYGNKKEHRLWAFLISVICMLGYPLNSLLFGFEHVSMAILILGVIIDVVYYYDNEILSLRTVMFTFFLLNFGLFCSYYMFVPYMYTALWIYFCIDNYKKNKKIITKRLILLLLITLLTPFIFGYIYNMEQDIYKVFINKNISTDKIMYRSSYLVNNGLKVDGYIYVNIYSNFILLIPLTIYLVIHNIKNKEKDESLFVILLTGCIVIFIAIMLINNKIGNVSTYYLCKNYFALWSILAYCNYKALVIMSEKNEYLCELFLVSYIILMIIYITFSKVKAKYVLNNNNESIFSVMEIFAENKAIIFDNEIEFNQDEIQILNYARENLDYNDEIGIITDETAYYWSYALLKYTTKDNMFDDECLWQVELTTKWYYVDRIINEAQYMIYFNKTNRYESIDKNILFNNSSVIFENNAGGIIKYNR